MLRSLAIRDVVLIEALDLEFGDGLAVITGETGAGKSILLDALGLALGARASTALVRHGAEAASVTAGFTADDSVRDWLDAQELDHDPGELLLIRRTVRVDGGSRATINGQPVSGAQLRSLGAQLVEIHGQHDDRGLLAPTGHRALLDAFGRIDTAPVRTAHGTLRAAEQRLADAVATQEAATRDEEWLRHAAAELTSFAPQPAEEAELADRRVAMQRSEKLAREVAALGDLIDGPDGAASALRQAARILDRLARDNPALQDTLDAVDRALIEVDAADAGLRAAAAAHPYDERALEADEARLFELRALARKHRTTPDALPALADTLAARLAAITDGGAAIGMAEAAVTAARTAYGAEADRVSVARQDAATRLDARVAGELAPLRLDAARFRTAIAPGPDGDEGRDRVEFEIATNPGAPFAPLTKIASGGELSRFILALKVALAEEAGAPTMVFDEIDRGVGGAVASAIGERLATLATARQVLVVTHSPQVAARGRSHLLIAKNSDGLVSRTSLRHLDEGERREEIARMLSGAEVTDEARAQARRLVG